MNEIVFQNILFCFRKTKNTNVSTNICCTKHTFLTFSLVTHNFFNSDFYKIDLFFLKRFRGVGCNSHESRRVLKFGIIRDGKRDTRDDEVLSLLAGNHNQHRRQRRPKQQYPQNHIQGRAARRRRCRRFSLQRPGNRLFSIRRRHGTAEAGG